jgi:fucose 4-O-acetylase-like acetyltransferase
LKKSNLRACKTLGGIAIGFFLTVSPWTITQLVMSLGQVDVNEVVDFVTTWIAVSNSFWNVVIYSFTNRSFRRAARTLIMKVVSCGRREETFEASTASTSRISRRLADDAGMNTG